MENVVRKRIARWDFLAVRIILSLLILSSVMAGALTRRVVFGASCDNVAVGGLFKTTDAEISLVDGKGINIAQTSNSVDTTADGANDTMLLALKEPLYLKDNTINDTLLSLDIKSLNKTNRDLDAISIVLRDSNNDSNYISIIIAANSGIGNTYSYIKARANGQKFFGYHNTNGSPNAYHSAANRMGTALEYDCVKTAGAVSLYYDNSAKKLYASPTISSYKGKIDSKFLVRDFTDNTHTTLKNNGEPAWTTGLESAYLTITAVRKSASFTDGISADAIVDSAHFASDTTARGTLSDTGSRYMITNINNQVMVPSGGVIESTPAGTRYFPVKPIVKGNTATIGQINKINVLEGGILSPDITYSENLFVKVVDSKSSPQAVTGLASDGKWKKGCSFSAEEGDYIIGYFKNSADVSPLYTASVFLPGAINYDNASIAKNEKNFTFNKGKGTIAGASSIQTGTLASDYYSGVILETRSEATIAYNKQINLANKTKNDLLLEFVVIAQNTGALDFSKLRLKFTDVNDSANSMSILMQDTPDDPKNKLSGISAGGGTQDYYGLKTVRSEYGQGKYATPVGLNFGGEAMRKYTSVGLYYDKAENSLYASSVYDFNSGKIEKRLVRNFNDESLVINAKTNPAGTVSQPLWGGFSGNVALEIAFEDVKLGKTARVAIINIGGEAITDYVYADSVSDGIVGASYKLPSPEYYSGLLSGNTKNLFEMGGGVQVKSPSGVIKEFFDAVSFVTDEKGIYVATYAIKDGTSFYGAKIEFEVFDTNAAPPINITIQSSEIAGAESFYCGTLLDISACAKTDLYAEPDVFCSIALALSKDDKNIGSYTASELSQQLIYNFNEAGVYKLVYTAIDYVGRTATSAYSFEIIRTIIEFASNDNKWLYEFGETIPVFAKTDVLLFEITPTSKVSLDEVSGVSYNTTIEIKIGESGNYTLYNSDYTFATTGTYYIKYTAKVTYSNDSDEVYIVRKIQVQDTTLPILGSEVAISGNIKADLSNPSTESVVYLRAKINTEVTVGKLSAFDPRDNGNVDLSALVGVELISAQGNKQSIAFVGDTVTISLIESGNYYLSYKVSDGTHDTKKVYVISVKEKWISFESTPATLEVEVKTTAMLSLPKIIDFDGAVENTAVVTAKVFYDKSEIKLVDNSFVPQFTGSYMVVYTAVCGAETIETSAVINVSDTTKPIIDLGGMITSGYTNERYSFALPIPTDNLDVFLTVKVFLVYDSKETELVDLYFVPTKAGEYMLRFMVVDAAGNTASESCTLTVATRVQPISGKKLSAGAIVAIVLSSVAVIGVGAFFGTRLILKKRKSKAK